MDQADDSERAAPKAKRAAPRHTGNLERSAVSARLLNKLIAELVAEDTPANVAALFENRASINTIRSWRNGNRYVAPWALQLLGDKMQRVAAITNEIPRGPGMRAGDKNLVRRWRT